MPGRQRFTPAQVIAALKATKGMVYIAAQRLECDPDTILNYCKRYPSVNKAKERARGEMVDTAELKLWQSIQNGEPWGITLCLKTLGKDRGYVEQQKVALTTPDGKQPWELTVGLAILLQAHRSALASTNGHAPHALPESTE